MKETLIQIIGFFVVCVIAAVLCVIIRNNKFFKPYFDDEGDEFR